jgi:Ion channel
LILTPPRLGYGDIPAGTLIEKIFAICWMMTGVFVYSFLIGTFSNIFTKMDQSKACMRQSLTLLKKFSESYCVSKELYIKARHIIKSGYKIHSNDYREFLKELPYEYSQEVGYFIYKSIVDGIAYFDHKPHELVVSIGPHLKPIVVSEGDFVYSKDDIAEESKSFCLKNNNKDLFQREQCTS